jgi:hypothetical protein
MSLSFPASPSNGQTYQGWVFNGASGAWDPNVAARGVTTYNGRAGAVLPQTGDETAGNRVLLQSQRVSSAVAQLDFAAAGGLDNTAYDSFDLDIINIIGAAGALLNLRFSADHGATFDATNAYSWGYCLIFADSTAMTYSAGNAVAQMQLAAAGYPTTPITQFPSSFKVRFTQPWSTTTRKMVLFDGNYWTTQYIRNVGFCQYSIAGNLTPIINGVRVFYTGQNIQAGLVNLYGIK